jgi:N-carbamoyl-L-amino-acid hydrolase
MLVDELQRIGYLGTAPLPLARPKAFVELHIEQGPILDAEGGLIGAVHNVQGISWQALTITGQSNHAGTTPMRLRRDPQVGTIGRIDLDPNLVNVVARSATFTVDLRNTDDALLRSAEARVAEAIEYLAAAEGATVTSRPLARFEPVAFDETVVCLVETVARERGLTVRRMPSGAGHDAQMLARVCPTAMVFVPSVDGISHNPAEHTAPADLTAGAEVLAEVMIRLART